MTINSKYNIGDVKFTMYNNKVVQIKITRISTGTEVDRKGNIITNISYGVTDCKFLLEDEIFSSKEELLKSL